MGVFEYAVVHEIVSAEKLATLHNVAALPQEGLLEMEQRIESQLFAFVSHYVFLICFWSAITYVSLIQAFIFVEIVK